MKRGSRAPSKLALDALNVSRCVDTDAARFPLVIWWVKHEIIGTETDASALVRAAETHQQADDERRNRTKLTKGGDGCRQGERYYTGVQSEAPLA